MDQDRTRASVAAYFEKLSRDRQILADALPEDVRERRSARGLLDVADLVRELPADDPRLDRIGTVSLVPDAGADAALSVGAAADELAYGFRYEDPLESPDALLDRFTAAVEAGASEFYGGTRTAVEVAADIDSADPTRALLAVRYVTEHLDAWEGAAVARAREADWSWERIAAVLGRKRQSVWSKHREGDHAPAIARAPRAVAAFAKAAITRVPTGRPHGGHPAAPDGDQLTVQADDPVREDDAAAPAPGLPEGAGA
jgi:hypothetical protein